LQQAIVLGFSSFYCFLQGHVNYADWAPGGWQPRTFSAKDITSSLVQQMRGGGQSAAVQAAALPDAAAPALDAETAAAVAQAFEATLTEAEAEVAAAQAAAAAAAAAQLQDADDEDDDDDEDSPPPACAAAAAIHSALTAVFEPLSTAQQLGNLTASDEPVYELIVPLRDTSGSTTAGGAATAASQLAAGAAPETKGRALTNAMPHLQHLHTAQPRIKGGRKLQTGKLRRLHRSWRLAAEMSSIRSAKGSPAADAPAAGPAGQAVPDIGGAAWMTAAGYVALASHCPLFARKFPASVSNHTLAMALSCAGIGLGSWCSDQQWLAQLGLHV
jgi:hypothetical protein